MPTTTGAVAWVICLNSQPTEGRVITRTSDDREKEHTSHRRAIVAAMYGTLIVVAVHDYWPSMSIVALLLLSVALYIALCFAGRWIAVRNELNKKLPASSEELRRGKKAFL